MRLNFIKASPLRNTTVLITDLVNPSCYAKIARLVMNDEYLNAEQVGYIVPGRNNQSKLRLEMSGGEFCGNAVLSAAAFSVYKGICQEESFLIEASGAATPLLCKVKAKANGYFTAKAEMPQAIKLERLEIDMGLKKASGCLVHLPGISHFVTTFWPAGETYNQMMDYLEAKVCAKALGIIPYRQLAAGKYEIAPYVYVRETGSRIFEKACGTGSLSLGSYLYHCLCHGESECSIQVLQPGGIINVEAGAKSFISTDVFFTCEGWVNTTNAV